MLSTVFSKVHAQTDVFPSSADVRLVQGVTGDQLLIQMKIHSTAGFGGIFSALTVTIRYDASSGMALGGGTSFCNAWSAFTPSPVIVNDGLAYRTYNGFGVSRLEDAAFDGGCGLSLVPEVWTTITTIPVSGNGCTGFVLGNDAFTQQANRDLYVSMGGHNVTGQVLGSSVNAGVCGPDCLGVPGGSALPGTPCDDQDPNTSGDTWGADCVCSGTTSCVTPAVIGTNSNSPICSNHVLDLSISTTGSGPMTYAWTGTGTFSPNAASSNVTVAGATTGTYQVTVSNACGNASASIPVVVQAAPSATIAYSGSPYCTTAGTAAVSRNGSSGGTYSASPGGLSINAGNGTINLGNSTAGTYTVTYTVAAANGCAAFSTTTTVVITAGPSATISYAGSPYCGGTGTRTVTRSGTGGGTYSSSPSGLGINGNNGTINLANSTAGTYTVTYTVAAGGGCTAFSTTAPVVITAGPSATISYAGSPYCGTTGTGTITRAGTGGGTYSSSPSGLGINANNGTINLANSTAGTYTVTYTIAADGGCAAFSTTASVVINAPSTWYADTDNDGIGNNSSTIQACTQPAGYVAVGGDLCPTDPAKIAPGICGCGFPDTDSDNDGTADCIDGCPTDPNKVAPGVCGCGIPDTDSDKDGLADCVDNCPLLAGVVGDACDDGDPTTVEDIITPACICAGTITIGIPENEQGHGVAVSLYPNPHVSGMVHLDIDGLDAGSRNVLIEMHDVSGRLVHQASVTPVGGKAHLAMDLSKEVGRGLYMVEVITESHRYLKRLVMQ